MENGAKALRGRRQLPITNYTSNSKQFRSPRRNIHVIRPGKKPRKSKKVKVAASQANRLGAASPLKARIMSSKRGPSPSPRRTPRDSADAAPTPPPRSSPGPKRPTPAGAKEDGSPGPSPGPKPKSGSKKPASAKPAKAKAAAEADLPPATPVVPDEELDRIRVFMRVVAGSGSQTSTCVGHDFRSAWSLVRWLQTMSQFSSGTGPETGPEVEVGPEEEKDEVELDLEVAVADPLAESECVAESSSSRSRARAGRPRAGKRSTARSLERGGS